MQHGPLPLAELTWLDVYYGDRTQRIAVVIKEWSARIKAQKGGLRYQGVVHEAIVLQQIFDNQRLSRLNDGVGTKCNLTFKLRHIQSKPRFEPQSV